MVELNTTYADFDTSALALSKKPNFNKKVSEEEIKETAQDFEAFFITKTMESMFDGVKTDGMFGGGHAEKIYRSMLLDEYGKVMSKTGSIGVSDVIMQSIIDMQEAQSNAQALTQ